MPPGKARAPGAGPDLESMRPGCFPEREVAGVALSRIDLTARAGEKLVGGVAREFAVGGEARDVVIDGPADLVRVSLFDQLGDELDHLGDVVACARVVSRRPDVDARRIVHEGLGVERRNFLGRLLFETRGHQHLVLAAVEGVVGEVADVGDVHHPLDFVAEVFERPG